MNSHGGLKTEPQVQGQVRPHFPIVLYEDSKRVVQAIGSEQRLLIVSVRQSQQELGPTICRPASVPPERRAIRGIALVAIRFALGKLRANLNEMRAVRDGQCV